MNAQDRNGHLHGRDGRYAAKRNTAPGATARLAPGADAPMITSLNPTGGIFVDQYPQTRAHAAVAPYIRPLSETEGGDFNDVVTVYRGAPRGAQIEPGDFITTNRQLAQDYAGNGDVISLQVLKGHIADDVGEPCGEEYLYLPYTFSPNDS